MINRQNIVDLPVAIAGISLGFTSISTVWEGLGGFYIRHFSILFACICIGLLFMKLLFDPKKVINELKHPVTGSLYFTTTMTLMTISNYLSNYIIGVAKIIWVGAIILHVIMFIAFLIFMSKDFNFEKMVPSWFVPAVGICVGAVTGKPMGFESLTKIIFYYAFTWLLILLPILIYRVKFYKAEIPQQAKMTLAIFAAPSSLCLAAYLGIFEPSKTILTVLVPLAYILTIYLYTLLPKFLEQPFTLGLAPLTFPLAIGVVATQRYVTYLTQIESKWVELITQVFFIQLIIATLVIGYVVYKTFVMSMNSILRKNESQAFTTNTLSKVQN